MTRYNTPPICLSPFLACATSYIFHAVFTFEIKRGTNSGHWALMVTVQSVIASSNVTEKSKHSASIFFSTIPFSLTDSFLHSFFPFLEKVDLNISFTLGGTKRLFDVFSVIHSLHRSLYFEIHRTVKHHQSNVWIRFSTLCRSEKCNNRDRKDPRKRRIFDPFRDA